MKTTIRYWLGILFASIAPLYISILITMAMTKNEKVTAIVFIGGIFILPGLITTSIWTGLFLTKYSKKEVEIKNYKLPLFLVGINVFVILVPFLLSIFSFISIFA